MKKRFYAASLVLVTAVFPANGSAQSVTIDQQSIKAKRICGDKMGEVGCKTTQFGLTLVQNDIPITETGGQPNYFNVLGKVVRKGDLTGTLNSL